MKNNPLLSVVLILLLIANLFVIWKYRSLREEFESKSEPAYASLLDSKVSSLWGTTFPSCILQSLDGKSVLVDSIMRSRTYTLFYVLSGTYCSSCLVSTFPLLSKIQRAAQSRVGIIVILNNGLIGKFLESNRTSPIRCAALLDDTAMVGKNLGLGGVGFWVLANAERKILSVHVTNPMAVKRTDEYSESLIRFLL